MSVDRVSRMLAAQATLLAQIERERAAVAFANVTMSRAEQEQYDSVHNIVNSKSCTQNHRVRVITTQQDRARMCRNDHDARRTTQTSFKA